MKQILDNDVSSLGDKKCYLLFYFTASWCGPCQRIKPMIEKLSEGLDESKIEIYTVDIDSNDELADKYNIRSVPTFLLILQDECIDQCSGADITKVHQLLKKNITQ